MSSMKLGLPNTLLCNSLDSGKKWSVFSQMDCFVLFWLRSSSQGMVKEAWIQVYFWIPDLDISCVALSFTALNLQLTHLWNKDNKIYLIGFYGKQMMAYKTRQSTMENKSSKLPFFIFHLVHNTKYISLTFWLWEIWPLIISVSRKWYLGVRCVYVCVSTCTHMCTFQVC